MELDPTRFVEHAHTTIEQWIEHADGDELAAAGLLYSLASKWVLQLGVDPHEVMERFWTEYQRQIKANE